MWLRLNIFLTEQLADGPCVSCDYVSEQLTLVLTFKRRALDGLGLNFNIENIANPSVGNVVR